MIRSNLRLRMSLLFTVIAKAIITLFIGVSLTACDSMNSSNGGQVSEIDESAIENPIQVLSEPLFMDSGDKIDSFDIDLDSGNNIGSEIGSENIDLENTDSENIASDDNNAEDELPPPDPDQTTEEYVKSSPSTAPPPLASPTPVLTPKSNSTPDPSPTQNPSPSTTPLPPPEPTPDLIPTITPSTSPSPIPQPTLTPVVPDEITQPEIIQPLALYSYTNDINTAIPIAGAALEARTVYIFFQGDSVTSVIYYCCKGVDGDSMGEPHHDLRRIVKTAPFQISIDMAQFQTSGTRELYLDYTKSDGSFVADNYYNFIFDAASSSGSPLPPPEPTSEPIPTTTPVILFSYNNDINTAELLEHATVKPQQVYFFTQGAGIQSITYFCCNSLFTNGQDTPESSLNKDTPPFALSVNLSQFTDMTTRELRFDYVDRNGELHANSAVQFDLHSTPVSSPTYIPFSVNITLSWKRPEFREDGQVLKADDIAGYSVHYFDANENEGIYFFSGDTLSWKTQLYEDIEYQFAIRTIDQNGLESKLSNTIHCSVSQLSGLTCF